MNFEVAIFHEMKRRGFDPHKITQAQYDSCALAIRTPKEIFRDAGAALASVVGTSARPSRRVSLAVYNARKAKCAKCPSFQRLQGNIPVCHICNCNGKLLETKWLDADQACPKDPSEWPACRDMC